MPRIPSNAPSPNPASLCRGPVSRRGFVQAGGLSLLGLGLADFLKLRATAATHAPRDTNVIFLWLPGGPPHLETYDMKPEAPMEFRGDFRPIRTNVPGIDVCELMPLHAKCADKYTIVRSCCHEFSDHGGGHKRFMTGRRPKEPTGFVNDAPAATSIVANRLGAQTRDGLPNVIVGTDTGRQGLNVFSLGPAWMGASNTPFIFHGDPSETDFRLDHLALRDGMAGRLDDRMALLDGFDRLRREVDARGEMAAMDDFNRQAVGMLTSEKVREAFDLSREPRSVRERYGMHRYGQRGLLARRLVEAGCRFVSMVWEIADDRSRMPKNCTYNWDSHAVNCHLFDDLRWRLPRYDQALTALIEDIHARGLDRDTLLIATGEFGRTPRINEQTGTQTGVKQPGRDHWPNAMSMLVSGGGMRTGQIVGATNAKGEHPVDRILSPNDLWATVYRHLGIDHNAHTTDLNGVPQRILPFGNPIGEILPRGA
ncbi:MAG: DUF1501 domain-containing protein [Verrucomicrobiae bacterium]|nr:DUF1501 domain-containing protein [Verrucomicrobiae bacterium]